MVYLKDRGLQEVLAMPEWSQKETLASNKLRAADWTVMANVVTVLKVTCNFLSSNLTSIQIFNEITLQLSHSSACISEVIFVLIVTLLYKGIIISFTVNK